jgi:hypothetical protein
MNLASRNYQEKRNFPRMNVHTPIEVTLENQPVVMGTCHNLSGDGLLISVDLTAAVGARMEITVSSGHGHKPVLKALTEVRRVLADAQRGSNLGLKILHLVE